MFCDKSWVGVVRGINFVGWGGGEKIKDKRKKIKVQSGHSNA